MRISAQTMRRDERLWTRIASEARHGRGREDAQMADAADRVRSDLRSEQETGEIAGHDEAGDGRAETLRRRADAQQRALQPIAEHQERHADQQCPDASRGGENRTIRRMDARHRRETKEGGAAHVAVSNVGVTL